MFLILNNHISGSSDIFPNMPRQHFLKPSHLIPTMRAFIFIATKLLDDDDIFERMSGFKYIENVYLVTGEFDFIIEIKAPDAEALLKKIAKIQGLEFVRRSEPCIAMETILEPTLKHKKITLTEKNQEMCKQIVVFVGANISGGSIHKSTQTLINRGNVKRIYGTTGMFNAFFEMVVKDLVDLRDIVKTFRHGRSVQNTESFLVIDLAELDEFDYEDTDDMGRRAMSLIKSKF